MKEQGATYCRPELKGRPLKQKTGNKHCRCGYKIRNKNHENGQHHQNSPIIMAEKAEWEQLLQAETQK